VGSCRRKLPNQVVALDERHLLRLMRDYVSTTIRIVCTALSKKTPRTTGPSSRSRQRAPR
jgi:hypothetical protein